MGKSCAIDSILPSVVSKPEDLPAGRILVPGAGASSKTEDGDEQAPWEADEQVTAHMPLTLLALALALARTLTRTLTLNPNP